MSTEPPFRAEYWMTVTVVGVGPAATGGPFVLWQPTIASGEPRIWTAWFNNRPLPAIGEEYILHLTPKQATP